MHPDDASARPFTVLIVCTANQCRSPMAEILLRDAADELGLGWAVRSAGLRTVDGRPMNPNARKTLLQKGHAPGAWRSTALRPELVDAADLVLTAEAAHRREVVTRMPTALSKTFLLVHFARLARQVPPLAEPAGADAGQLLVEAVLQARPLVQPVAPGSDDIDDPIGRSRRAFRACADILDTAVDAIVAPLRTTQ